ncbi:beta-mannosidase [Anaerosporobacter faecicola]|uniref:beta-mannosidase n=1 Tax=Anaerosporobacter faecicola TaxID=2718714 RepID=UPI00143C2D38|nr:glycoside hydrolase family 2 protein [Anaerosporobacter faecicola]
MNQQKISLNGIWQLKRADGKAFDSNVELEQTTKDCKVTIPGSVLSGLLENGLLEDPYYRTNEYFTRKVLGEDFVFTRRFQLDKKQGMVYELLCDGIDTIADLYVNDQLVQSVDNMHIRYQIPCTEVLKNGENTIRIVFQSPITYIENYIPEEGKEIHFTTTGAMPRNQYIRKAHSMFGWDWGPQLPDMGIWRDIAIRGFSVAHLDDVKIKQEHGKGQVTLLTEASVTLEDGRRLGIMEAQDCVTGLEVQYDLRTPNGEHISFKQNQCVVEQPQLWWPNRYGEQPLYTIQATLRYKGESIDEKSYRIGLRTLTVSREKDQWGEEFAFCVNGVKIFAKGANYIPEDCVYNRITKERLEYLIDSSVEVGYNCLRVWGGGYYPSNEFYDLCDEKGLIIWQDFMYACNLYELTEHFQQSIEEETRDNVRRLRHHACLGLWCGNNEIETAWQNWGEFSNHSDALRKDYLTIFEEIIPRILGQEDEATFYWPSSPSSGGNFQDPDGNNQGDRHYWDVWHGEKPFSDYENYYFRFCSEFGFQSFPCLETIKTFTVPEDRNIFTEVMESHQKNGSANGKIMRYISDNFLYSKDFQSLIYISQVLQGIAMKYGIEHWRRNRGRCMGSIYWQLNDDWPVASWSSIDYFGRWKALHYMARHFYADVLGSLKIDGTILTPYVQNETRVDTATQITIYVKDLDCNVIYEKTASVHTKALGVTSTEAIDVKPYTFDCENKVILEAKFVHSDGTCTNQVELLRPYKYMRLKQAHITCDVKRRENQLILTVASDAVALFTEITVHGVDVILSDNYFHLTDKEEHVITATLPEEYEGVPNVTICSLCDSYSF